MPRRPRGHTDCRLHHITVRGNNRRSMFEDTDDRECYYDLLGQGIAGEPVKCHQDVQMGNHVHLLLDGKMADISKLMWFVSHRYALAYNRRHGRVNHLVGRRFHAAEIPDWHAARAVSVYIAMNPVRAGLCRSPVDWRYGSYRSHAVGEAARPHLTTDFTCELFAMRGTSFEAAVDAAIARQQGGRPPLGAILPSPEQLTREHVVSARHIFGFTAPEIAAHYGRSTKTVTRWLADR